MFADVLNWHSYYLQLNFEVDGGEKKDCLMRFGEVLGKKTLPGSSVKQIESFLEVW